MRENRLKLETHRRRCFSDVSTLYWLRLRTSRHLTESVKIKQETIIFFSTPSIKKYVL